MAGMLASTRRTGRHGCRTGTHQETLPSGVSVGVGSGRIDGKSPVLAGRQSWQIGPKPGTHRAACRVHRSANRWIHRMLLPSHRSYQADQHIHASNGGSAVSPAEGSQLFPRPCQPDISTSQGAPARSPDVFPARGKKGGARGQPPQQAWAEYPCCPIADGVIVSAITGRSRRWCDVCVCRPRSRACRA